jgi:hypothetical protein
VWTVRDWRNCDSDCGTLLLLQIAPGGGRITVRCEKCLIDHGIIQYKRNISSGSLSLALLHGKNTKFRAGCIGLYSGSCGGVGGEEVDIRLIQKHICNSHINKC